MKKLVLYTSSIATVFLFACKKETLQDLSSFDATVNVLKCKAGDSVIFSLSGNPDNISFFSGEKGRMYDLKDVTYAEGGIPQMQFSSNVRSGAAGTNNLSVLVSSDFSGIYDTANVRKATWNDITTRVTLGTTTTNVSSGKIDLAEFKNEGKPLYVAFRYQTVLPVPDVKQREWQITGFQFTTSFPDGKTFTNAASNSDAAFGNISFKGDSTKWSGTTTLQHPASDIKGTYPAVDNWAISRYFNINQVTPDVTGIINIKSITSNTPAKYFYIYKEPGTYKAVFEAMSFSRNKSNAVTKEFTIVVTP